MPLWDTFKDVIGYETPQQQTSNPGDLYDAETGKNRITMIGTMGAGKSAHLASLLIAADRKVSKSRNTEYPFRYLIEEGSGNIEHDKSAMRAGHFPPKTGALKASVVEPGLTFEWSHVSHALGKEITLSRKIAKMPIADLAGEDLCQLIEKVSQVRTLQQASQINAERITNIITQSEGLMFIIKATRAQGLGIQLEKEPVGIDGLSIYSDANYKRMINGIVKYKRQHPNSPPLRGIAVVITAWDGLASVAKQIEQITGSPFDPTFYKRDKNGNIDTTRSQEILDKFLYMCFPSTHAAITSLHLGNVKYFPSFIETEKDSTGNPVCWEGTQSPKISCRDLFDPTESFEDNVNSIHYSYFWLNQELDWLKNFAEQS
jgi:hypothetical protein